MKKLSDLLFPGHAKDKPSATAFQTIAEYAPAFTTYGGSIYELALTRRAIDSFASNFSKLRPVVMGTAQPKLRRNFRSGPNKYQTWPQFLYRVATMLECDTTVAIVPAFGPDLETYTGIWPLKFDYAELVECAEEPWIRFHLPNGDIMAIEYRHVCLLTKYQYESDIFGTPNVLDSTMELIHFQEQAQKHALKNGAVIRFIAAVDGMLAPEQIEEKRKDFSDRNLSEKNKSALLIYDSTFRDLKEVDPRAYTIDADQMELINNNVFTYFGTNEYILQNKFDEEKWDAYYEGKIEPPAIQLGDGLSKLLFSEGELLNNSIMFSSNRLEYASAASKRNMIRDMVDRRIFSINEAREILQLPPVEGGDVFVVRGEYVDAALLYERTAEKAAKKSSANAGKSSESDTDGKDDDFMQNDKQGQEEGVNAD